MREIVKHAGLGKSLNAMEDHFLFARGVMYFLYRLHPARRVGVVGRRMGRGVGGIETCVGVHHECKGGE